MCFHCLELYYFTNIATLQTTTTLQTHQMSSFNGHAFDFDILKIISLPQFLA